MMNLEDAAPGENGAHNPGCSCAQCTAVARGEALSELQSMLKGLPELTLVELANAADPTGSYRNFVSNWRE